MAAVVAASLVPGHAVASANPGAKPCGHVVFAYDSERVSRGDRFAMGLTVTNCSDQTERLRVRARSSGPCEFAHPATHTYRVLSQYSVGRAAVIDAPSCPGRYSVRIRLTLAGQHRVLDTARGGFIVKRD
jgi:hypothetical protein